MKKSLLFLFAMVFSLVGWGQSTANYTFSTSTTGSLVLDANTNAVDMSTGTTQLIAPSSDATVSSVTNIGFNFFFMGNNYTQFSASADGWIGLGSIAVSGTTNSGASTTTPKITAMGGDLYVGASGKVHYKLIGTAPNRCLVIEFNNLAVYYSTTAGNAVNVYQVRLYETTSIIEYIYGNMYCGLTTYSPGYVGFGSGTAANTQLSVTTSTNTVSTGSTFNTNAYTAATNIANLYSVLNGSRRIYKFTPQSTTPTDPITMTFSSIAASGMTVNWIDNSTTETYFTLIRATDVGFTQNVVTSNINSTTIAGTGNSYNSGAITGLTPSTTYYFKVIASNEASVPSFGITGSQTTNSPLIYTWNQTASAVYATAANWTPTRTTPDATDILVFDGASTPAPIVTGVTTQTIGQLKLLNNANVQIQGSSTTLTLVGGTGDDFVIPSGSTLQINGASSLSIAYSGSGHVGNIAGTLSLSGSTSNSYSASNSTTSVTGTINNFGSITGSISSLIFSNGSIYNHNYTTSAGTIPTATWNATSNCNIISYTSNTSAPSGIAQTFGNFTWNCTGQTGNLSLAGSAIVANGTFTMSSTNTGSLRMVASSGSGSIVANNFTQTGGSLDFSSGSSSGTLKVAGTFNQSAGTITESGTGTANTIEFNGSTNQSVTFGGTLTNTLSYRINNNAGITLSGTMAITTGSGLIISSTAVTPITGGTIAYTGVTTLTYNSTTGNQTATANEFPNTNGPTNLTINIPSYKLSIPFDRTISGTGVLTMTAGDIDMGAYTLTLGTGIAAMGTLTYTAGGIIGNFKRWVSAAIASKDYPVGVAYNARKATINYTVAPTTGGTLTARFIPTDPGTTGLPLTQGAITVNTASKSGYWKFDAADGLAGGTYAATFTVTNLPGVTAVANLVLIKRPSSGSWVLDGTHVTTTGSNTTPVLSRTGITTGFSEFGVGGDAATNPMGGGNIASIATGNWGDPSIWNTNTVPVSGDYVTISAGNTVTTAGGTPPYVAYNLIIAATATLNASDALTIGNVLTNNGTFNSTAGTTTVTGASTTGIINASTTGFFNVNGGTVTLGPAGGSNRTFTNNGTMTVASGTLNINGNLYYASTGIFNQSGGNINIDGNAAGVSANSVASGTYLLNINAAVNWTGGTLTIVDPHANSTSTYSLYYNTSTSSDVSTLHTFQFGDGISSDAGGNAVGYYIYNYVGSGKLNFGNMTVYGPATGTALSTNRIVKQYSLTNGIRGNLLITGNGELDQNSIGLIVGGNITVNSGSYLTNNATLTLALSSGTSSSASISNQTIGGTGTYRNLSSSATANLNSLTINNTNASGVIISTPLSISGTLTLTSGIVNTSVSNLLTLTSAATLSGTPSASNMINGPFARSFAASRTAVGTYTLATLFPVGKGTAYLPLWIDPTTTAGGAVTLSGETFTSTSGSSMGSGVTSLSNNRWEAIITSGSGNFTSSNIQLGDASILTTNKILQSTTAVGSYGAIIPATSYTAATPNIIKTTGTQILAAAYYGYFAYGDLTSCIAPANQANTLVTTNMTTTSFSGSFTAASSNPSNYLVVRYATAVTPSLTPADYTTYVPGAAFGNGTIVSINTTTTFNASGLSAATAYDFYIYSFNNSACYGPVYNTVSPLKATVTTCATTTGTPGTPTSSLITTSSITASWTASSTSGVNYLLDVATDAGFTSFVSGYNGLDVGLGTLSSTISGLTASTTYYVRVKAVVSGCNSAYSSSLIAATACNAENIPTTIQGFESESLPVCWSTSLVSGSIYWASATLNDGVPSGHSSSYFMGKVYTISDALIYSQPINMTSSVSGGRINVWIYRNTVNKANDRIRFHINTTQSLTGAFQLLEIFPLTTQAPTVSSAGWYNYTVNIPASYNSNATVYIIAQGTTDGTTASYGIGFDDFIVEGIPTPTISSLGSSSGCVGTSLTINGTGLSGATAVTIGGTTATITSNTDIAVTVTVGSGTTGYVAVTNIVGTATSVATFTVNQNPTVVVDYPSTQFCGSGSKVLTASGAVTYSWSPASGLTATNTASVTATPSVTTTYIVTGTASGCSSTASATITINLNPTAVTVTPSTATICATTIQPLAASGGTISSQVNVGPASPTAEGGTIGTQATAWDINFTTLNSTTIASVDIFPITSGQAGVIKVLQGTGTGGTVLATINYTTNVSGGSTAQTIAINCSLPTPGSYSLYPTLPTGGLSRNISGAVYPYTSSVANITGNGYNTSYFMGMYNWNFGVSVPTIFTWSPYTDLYTDALATSAYAGTATSTVYTKPTANITYTATATSAAGCTNSNTANITFNAASQGGSVTADQTICSGSNPVDLSLGSNLGNVVRWEKSANVGFSSAATISSTAATLASASIGSLSATTYFRAVVKNGVCANANSTPALVNVDATTVAGSVAGVTPILGGQTATLTLSGNIGSLTKWQRAFNSGSWSDVVSTANPYTEIPTTLGTWNYRAVVQSGVCPSATATQGNVLVNANYTTFTGGLNTDWNTVGNWDRGVPSKLYDATIPANLLAVVNSNNYECNNLSISPLGKLTINSGKDLLVNATLSLLSDVTGSASFIDYGTIVYNSATTQCYLSGNVYHQLGLPISNSITAGDVFMNCSLDKYNESDDTYTGFTATSTITANQGYMVQYAYVSPAPSFKILNFTGNFNTGDMPYALTYSGVGHGYNLVPNPYPSGLDWDQSNITSNATATQGSNAALWIWNESSGTWGTYVSGDAGIGTNVTTNIIAPMQAFFVKATAAGTFTIPNQARVHPGAQGFLKATPVDILKLHVSSTMNTYSDEIIVNFKSNATPLQGAAKWFSFIPTAPTMYSVKNNANYAINTLAAISNNLVVPLGFKAGVNGNYTIKASELNSFAPSTYIYLKDLASNTLKDLNQNANYTFAAATTDNADRFQLIFAYAPLGISNNSTQNTSIYAYENTIFVNSSERIQCIGIYNTLGQLIKSFANSLTKMEIDMKGQAMGYYIVRVVTDKNAYSEKLLIK